MAKRRELTFRNFISIGGADPVPWDSLSDEMKEKARRNIIENFAASIDESCRLDPKVFETIPDIGEELVPVEGYKYFCLSKSEAAGKEAPKEQ